MSNKKQHDEEHSKIYKVWLWVKRWWLPIAILLITSIGLACALSIPQRVFETPREPANDKSAPVLLAQSNLRLAFLYITGGAIAVMGLVETFRKNNNEKLKNDQDKEKNDRDHLRQVRTERRERYTKAVEQLGDEKAPIRMGGVYTLVGLIDEWLEDESIEKYEDRLKEGQVIINNLCAYIRSPFALASHYNELSNPTLKEIYKDKKEKFYADIATLDSESDVRLSIIKEIHDRLQGPGENTPGTWSDFEYDFSGSVFFYPVDLTKSYYKKPINFSGSTYQEEAYFSGSTYKSWAYFTDSTYQALAYFSSSTYQALAYFSSSIYQGGAYFSRSIYQSRADFSGSTYQSRADFSGSIYIYQGGTNFTGSTYQSRADFTDSIYQGWADFTDSIYQGEANFSRSTYQGEANFSRSTYRGRATFNRSTYENETNFSGSIFYQETYFGKGKYSNSSSCFTNRAPQFYDKTNRKNTLFGSHNNDFTVDIDKGYSINLNSEGLPLGCKFLTSEQKEFLKGEIQEIEETNNKLLEVKDPKEKAELLKKLQSFDDKLHKWREEVTTVKVEDVAAEDTKS